MCQGGRGLADIDDYINALIEGLEDYSQRNKEVIIAAANNSQRNSSKDRKTIKTWKQI